MDNIQKYVKERDEMLLKCSVDELKKFVGKYESSKNGEMRKEVRQNDL